jgi:hypothetical protein
MSDRDEFLDAWHARSEERRRLRSTLKNVVEYGPTIDASVRAAQALAALSLGEAIDHGIESFVRKAARGGYE